MKIDKEAAAVLLPKDCDQSIAIGLNAREIRCHCTNEACDFTLVCRDLLDAYSELRKTWAKPIFVTSGFRCQMHNLDVGGVAQSSHVKGLAMDLSTGNMNDLDRQRFINLCKTIFSFVKVYPTWVHVQINK